MTYLSPQILPRLGRKQLLTNPPPCSPPAAMPKPPASTQPASIPRSLHLTLESHSGPVHVVRYAKQAAKHILTGGQDRTIRLWNPETGVEIKSYKGHGYEVLSLCVSVPSIVSTE